MTVARNVLKAYEPHEGLWPTEYIPAKREKARKKFESLFEKDPELRAIADGSRANRQGHREPCAYVSVRSFTAPPFVQVLREHMKIADPRAAHRPGYTAWIAGWLNDSRDAQLVGLIGQCLALSASGVGMFFFPHWVRYTAPLYWVLLVAGLLDRFTLMLHCTSHRPLFKAKHRVLNLIIPCLLAPFFGQTPHTYFAHHLGMHHREENLPGDLSSTMRFQRDSFKAWLRYWARFLSLGVVDLVVYMRQRGQHRLLRRVVAGETAYWSLLALLLYLRPAATLVVHVAVEPEAQAQTGLTGTPHSLRLRAHRTAAL